VDREYKRDMVVVCVCVGVDVIVVLCVGVCRVVLVCVLCVYVL